MKNKVLFIITLLLIVSITPVHGLSSDSFDVTVGKIDDKVYNVDITWGEMKFIYKEEETFSWVNHEYNREEINYTWIAKGNDIDINNESYFDVNMKCTYKSYNSSITGKFSKSEIEVKALKKAKVKLDLNGTLSKDITTFTKIGKITLEMI